LEEKLKDLGPLVVAIVVDEIASNFSDDLADLALEMRAGFVLQQKDDLLFQFSLSFSGKLKGKIDKNLLA
jgi:hypothetical protein